MITTTAITHVIASPNTNAIIKSSASMIRITFQVLRNVRKREPRFEVARIKDTTSLHIVEVKK